MRATHSLSSGPASSRIAAECRAVAVRRTSAGRSASRRKHRVSQRRHERTPSLTSTCPRDRSSGPPRASRVRPRSIIWFPGSAGPSSSDCCKSSAARSKWPRRYPVHATVWRSPGSGSPSVHRWATASAASGSRPARVRATLRTRGSSGSVSPCALCSSRSASAASGSPCSTWTSAVCVTAQASARSAADAMASSNLPTAASERDVTYAANSSPGAAARARSAACSAQPARPSSR